MVSVPVAPSTQVRPSASVSWQPIVWFGGLLILCYAPILYRLGVQWATDEDMGHGFLVPIVAGFIAWQRRGILAATPRQPNAWGLVLVIFTSTVPCEASCSAVSRTLAPTEAPEVPGEKITFTCDGSMAKLPTDMPTPLEVKFEALSKMSWKSAPCGAVFGDTP